MIGGGACSPSFRNSLMFVSLASHFHQLYVEVVKSLCYIITHSNLSVSESCNLM